MSFVLRVQKLRQFFEPSEETMCRLVAAVSERAACSARPFYQEKNLGELPWVKCRQVLGLTQALFLVCFCRKFGFLPHMDENDQESDQDVWDALYEFERIILVSWFHLFLSCECTLMKSTIKASSPRKGR